MAEEFHDGSSRRTFAVMRPNLRTEAMMFDGRIFTGNQAMEARARRSLGDLDDAITPAACSAARRGAFR